MTDKDLSLYISMGEARYYRVPARATFIILSRSIHSGKIDQKKIWKKGTNLVSTYRAKKIPKTSSKYG